MPRHPSPAVRLAQGAVIALLLLGPVIGPGPAPGVAVPAPPMTPSVALDSLPPSVGPAPAPREPDTLHLPTLDVSAPVDPVDVAADGSLGVPNDPRRVGWWRAGARPGGAGGAVVLDGHVDTRRDGPGALFRLFELRRGDVVVVSSAAAQDHYVVQDVRRYPKPDLPPGIFASTGSPRLVLITCGGPFDRRTRQYADNTVVTATPG